MTLQSEVVITFLSGKRCMLELSSALIKGAYRITVYEGARNDECRVVVNSRREVPMLRLFSFHHIASNYATVTYMRRITYVSIAVMMGVLLRHKRKPVSRKHKY